MDTNQIEAVNQVAGGICQMIDKVAEKLTPLGAELLRQTSEYGYMRLKLLGCLDVFLLLVAIGCVAAIVRGLRGSTNCEPTPGVVIAIVIGAVCAMIMLPTTVSLFESVKPATAPMLYLLNGAK